MPLHRHVPREVGEFHLKVVNSSFSLHVMQIIEQSLHVWFFYYLDQFLGVDRPMPVPGINIVHSLHSNSCQ